MQLKPLVVASLAALASLSSHAATTDWGVHGLLESDLKLTSVGVFYDTYTFELSTVSSVASSITSLGTIVPATYGLFNLGMDGLVGTADDSATPYAWTFGGAPTVHTVTLAAGSYYYAVLGLGQTAGAYSISSAAAPVPEPETYAMLLAGLGVVGFLSRRRRPLD